MTDRPALGPEQFVNRLRQAIQAGVDWIQLREKATPTRELVQVAGKVLSIQRGARQKVILNDRLDVALACGFDGIHLGGTSFPVGNVRKMVPSGFIVGASVHHLNEALEAERDGADYVIFGPIFTTPSKLQYGLPQGIQKLRAVASALSVPVLAIGGITLSNYQECLEAGAAGIAAISLFQKTKSLRRVFMKMRSVLKPAHR